MEFDVEKKILEFKGKLEEAQREGEEDKFSPEWFHLLKKALLEGDLEQLQAIKDGKFNVRISLNVYFQTFGSKEFEVAEFNVCDENTVKCAVAQFKKSKKEL